MKLFDRKENHPYGAIIVTDFRKLHPSDFYLVHGAIKDMNKELILCSYAGRLYVNSNQDRECAKLLFDLFELLSRESRDTLQEYAKVYADLFPEIKTLEDWAAMKDTDENRTQALAMLCVPVELKRREIMLNYVKGNSKNNLHVVK